MDTETPIKTEVILFLGETEIGDVAKFAKGKSLHKEKFSKRPNGGVNVDTFSFNISRKALAGIISRNFDDPVDDFIKVGKLKVVFIVNGVIAFDGWLGSQPARTNTAYAQSYSLKFIGEFGRLAGDVVCAANNKMNPKRSFTDTPANEIVISLINEFKLRAQAAGEQLNWTFGKVDILANKTVSYKDFQPLSKALCDMMNNTTSAADFDVIFRIDPENYSHHFIDILKNRGGNKNIIVNYPGDGVYKLFSSTMETEERNDFASEVISYGSGELGDTTTGENTAPLDSAANPSFVQEFMYWRTTVSSNLEAASDGTHKANESFAKNALAQKSFAKKSPKISLVGRPIKWFDTDNQDSGLDIGDVFYFKDESNIGSDESGYVEIVALDISYSDSDSTETVTPELMYSEA